MKKKNAFVIQARMGSKRLPGKVLLPITKYTLIEFLINRIRNFNLNLNIIVATSDKSIDDIIVSHCKKIGVSCFAGSEENVLKRYQDVAVLYNIDNIIRLTADNPYPSKEIICGCLNIHLNNNYDLTTTRKIEGLDVIRYVPKGYSVDILKCKSLLNFNSEDVASFSKEHVIPEFYNSNYSVGYYKNENLKVEPLSIDTLEDYIRVQNYIENNAIY